MGKPVKRMNWCPRARKVIFPNELEAKIALAQRQRQDKGEKRYYPCNFGKHYHLTSQEARHPSERR